MQVMQKLLWLDLEMTGLKPETDKILEVAAIVTTHDLKVLETFTTAVWQSKEVLDSMDAWCQEHHGKSGLIERVKHGMPEQDAEAELIKLVDRHFTANDKVVLCGNSIWQDRRFIENYFKNFAAKLFYRMLDVSTFKLVFENYFNIKFKKQEKHMALDDVQESIEEFKYYYKAIDVTKLIG